MSLVAYLIHHVDEDLGISLTEAINHIGRTSREDRLNKGREFIIRGGASDQSLPSFLLGVDRDGWIGEMFRWCWAGSGRTSSGTHAVQVLDRPR